MAIHMVGGVLELIVVMDRGASFRMSCGESILGKCLSGRDQKQLRH